MAEHSMTNAPHIGSIQGASERAAHHAHFDLNLMPLPCPAPAVTLLYQVTRKGRAAAKPEPAKPKGVVKRVSKAAAKAPAASSKPAPRKRKAPKADTKEEEPTAAPVKSAPKGRAAARKKEPEPGQVIYWWHGLWHGRWMHIQMYVSASH